MPKAFERCLEHVQGKVRNPFAACTAVDAGGVKEVRRREARARRRRRSRRHGRKRKQD